MYNPINYKKFEMFLTEAITNSNTDKEVKLKDYTTKVNDYNSKKNNFKNILTKDQKTWEDEAAKIINGNIYLDAAWKIAKTNKQIEDINNKIKSGELTKEEVREMQDKLKEYQDNLNKDQSEISTKIKKDLYDIQHS